MENDSHLAYSPENPLLKLFSQIFRSEAWDDRDNGGGKWEIYDVIRDSPDRRICCSRYFCFLVIYVQKYCRKCYKNVTGSCRRGRSTFRAQVCENWSRIDDLVPLFPLRIFAENSFSWYITQGPNTFMVFIYIFSQCYQSAWILHTFTDWNGKRCKLMYTQYQLLKGKQY